MAPVDISKLSKTATVKALMIAVRTTQGTARASYAASARPNWWIPNHPVTLPDGSAVVTGPFVSSKSWTITQAKAALHLYHVWNAEELASESTTPSPASPSPKKASRAATKRKADVNSSPSPPPPTSTDVAINATPSPVSDDVDRPRKPRRGNRTKLSPKIEPAQCYPSPPRRKLTRARRAPKLMPEPSDDEENDEEAPEEELDMEPELEPDGLKIEPESEPDSELDSDPEPELKPKRAQKPLKKKIEKVVESESESDSEPSPETDGDSDEENQSTSPQPRGQSARPPPPHIASKLRRPLQRVDNTLQQRNVKNVSKKEIIEEKQIVKEENKIQPTTTRNLRRLEQSPSSAADRVNFRVDADSENERRRTASGAALQAQPEDGMQSATSPEESSESSAEEPVSVEQSTKEPSDTTQPGLNLEAPEQVSIKHTLGDIMASKTTEQMKEKPKGRECSRNPRSANSSKKPKITTQTNDEAEINAVDSDERKLLREIEKIQQQVKDMTKEITVKAQGQKESMACYHEKNMATIDREYRRIQLLYPNSVLNLPVERLVSEYGGNPNEYVIADVVDAVNKAMNIDPNARASGVETPETRAPQTFGEALMQTGRKTKRLARKRREAANTAQTGRRVRRAVVPGAAAEEDGDGEIEDDNHRNDGQNKLETPPQQKALPQNDNDLLGMFNEIGMTSRRGARNRRAGDLRRVQATIRKDRIPREAMERMVESMKSRVEELQYNISLWEDSIETANG